MTDETTGSRMVKNVRLVPAVMDSLLERIVRGEFPSEGFMPPEGELVQEYGVSRTVVREALSLLQGKGVITIRQGRGTSVRERNSWNLLDQDIIAAIIGVEGPVGSLVRQLVHLRTVIEPQVAQAAALQAGGEDLENMAATVAAMQHVTDDRNEYQQLDAAFHDRIAQASGQQVTRRILTMIRAWTVMPDVQDAKFLIPESIAEHQAILDAIRVEDPDLAGELMASHVEKSYERFVQAHAALSA